MPRHFAPAEPPIAPFPPQMPRPPASGAKPPGPRRDQPRINPDSIATAALLELDPKKVSLPAVLAGCHLALRQIARGQLRKRFLELDDDEDAVEPEQSQHDGET